VKLRKALEAGQARLSKLGSEATQLRETWDAMPARSRCWKKCWPPKCRAPQAHEHRVMPARTECDRSSAAGGRRRAGSRRRRREARRGPARRRLAAPQGQRCARATPDRGVNPAGSLDEHSDRQVRRRDRAREAWPAGVGGIARYFPRLPTAHLGAVWFSLKVCSAEVRAGKLSVAARSFQRGTSWLSKLRRQFYR
jgi:hypothetical protein